MSLQELFLKLADALDGPQPIEHAGATALRQAAPQARPQTKSTPLPPAVLKVMSAPDAHPVCALIAQTPFDWTPPHTSTDPAYIAHSTAKVHVELVGPEGLAPSETVRLGLYGIGPNFEYGLRTHAAEEIFVMLAGEADWMRGDAPYAPLRTGGRAHHPSMLPHATRTGAEAFMSLYIWHGDVATSSYVYQGLPKA